MGFLSGVLTRFCTSDTEVLGLTGSGLMSSSCTKKDGECNSDKHQSRACTCSEKKKKKTQIKTDWEQIQDSARPSSPTK